MATKILLVEDEPKVSAFIRRGLEEEGYEVTVAYDGPFGLRLALNKEFDLLILDVILPGQSGLVGLPRSQAMAQGRVDQAIAALVPVESTPGALAALARYAVERRA